jgi:uncharacterized SAM-binding protein YcdF (DUF218 family)
VVRRFSRFFIILFLSACGVFVTRDLWLTALGNALIHADAPANADIAVVLAGDMTGARLIAGAELVRKGYVPRVLVSGPPGIYGLNESELAIRFGVAHGYPPAWFVPLPHTALSTQAEAGVVLTALRTRRIHSFLLVTSDFHTARARRIYLGAERRMGGGPSMRVVAAPYAVFTPSIWWHDREGRKTVVLEWIKTLTGPLGI